MKRLDLGLLVVLALAFTACGDEENSNNGNGVNQAPTASFTIDPPSTPLGDGNTTVITLDASSSSDPDGDALTYSWDVTAVTYVQGTSSSSQIAKVTFPGVAPYAVTLTVTDPDGLNDSTSGAVQVQ